MLMNKLIIKVGCNRNFSVTKRSSSCNDEIEDKDFIEGIL